MSDDIYRSTFQIDCRLMEWWWDSKVHRFLSKSLRKLRAEQAMTRTTMSFRGRQCPLLNISPLYNCTSYRSQKIEVVGRSSRYHDEEHHIHVVAVGSFRLHRFKQSNCNYLGNSSEWRRCHIWSKPVQDLLGDSRRCEVAHFCWFDSMTVLNVMTSFPHCLRNHFFRQLFLADMIPQFYLIVVSTCADKHTLCWYSEYFADENLPDYLLALHSYLTLVLCLLI